jgi:type I restriction enzyme S subunit
MKKLRQSILAKAFRGELTERDPHDEPAGKLLETIGHERRLKWEQLRSGKMKEEHIYKELALPIATGLGKLPDKWRWATLETLTEFGGVSYGVLKRGQHVPSGIPVVQIRDIVNGELRLKTMMRTSAKIADNYKRTILSGGEIVIAIRGTVGRTALVPIALAGANVSREIAVIPVLPSLSTEYVRQFLESEYAQRQMKQKVKGVAVTGINLADLRKLVVPVAPLSEQYRVVEEIKGAFLRIDLIEQAVDRGSERVRSLEQSVLVQAFRGELISQDNNDQSSSAPLLSL